MPIRSLYKSLYSLECVNPLIVSISILSIPCEGGRVKGRLGYSDRMTQLGVIPEPAVVIREYGEIKIPMRDNGAKWPRKGTNRRNRQTGGGGQPKGGS